MAVCVIPVCLSKTTSRNVWKARKHASPGYSRLKTGHFHLTHTTLQTTATSLWHTIKAHANRIATRTWCQQFLPRGEGRGQWDDKGHRGSCRDENSREACGTRTAHSGGWDGASPGDHGGCACVFPRCVRTAASFVLIEWRRLCLDWRHSSVAYKCFADNVPLVIDHELVRGSERSVLSILNTGLDINGTDGLRICRELAQESHAVANRREELMKKLERTSFTSEELLKIGVWADIRWYDCIASYAHTGRLFAILPMFPRRSDCAATYATSRILRFLAATFLQLVLHAGRGYEITNQMIMYHKNPILHIPWHPLLAFKNCALLRLCAFLWLLCIFTSSIRPYIGSLSRTSRASDQSHNRFISLSSCAPAVECYC